MNRRTNALVEQENQREFFKRLGNECLNGQSKWSFIFVIK